ncbi:hypothetical protein [Crenothrix sp.]|uniref:hypothetical protein n=1 Tax=Crenothrix sp. TaxID=3100433 RepID=UPI00374C9B50
MKTPPVQLGQTHPKTNLESRFEVFDHGRLIAENMEGFRALRLKKRYPSLCVKFAGMLHLKGSAV